jgi:hypothetical protein
MSIMQSEDCDSKREVWAFLRLHQLSEMQGNGESCSTATLRSDRRCHLLAKPQRGTPDETVRLLNTEIEAVPADPKRRLVSSGFSAAATLGATVLNRVGIERLSFGKCRHGERHRTEEKLQSQRLL